MISTAPALRRPSNLDGSKAAASTAAAPAASVMLRAHNGEVVTLDTYRWHAPATPEERALLGTVAGPVIDLGSGPSRLVADLAGQGVTAKIINVTSVHQEIPNAGGADYDCSKGALRNLTSTLALELASLRINVNNLAPGMVLTPFNRPAIDDPTCWPSRCRASRSSGRQRRPRSPGSPCSWLRATPTT